MKKIVFIFAVMVFCFSTYAQIGRMSKKDMINRLDQLDLDLTKIDRAILDKAVDLKCDDEENLSKIQQLQYDEINQLIRKGKVIASEMQKLNQDYMQTAKTYKSQLEANKVLSKYGFGTDSDFISYSDKASELSEDISVLQADLAKVPAVDEVKKVGLQDAIMRKQCEISDLSEEQNRVMQEKASNPLANINNFMRQRPALYNSTDALTWYCSIESQRAITTPLNSADKTKCYKDDLAQKIIEATDKMYPQKNKVDENDNLKISKPDSKFKTEAGFQLPGFNSGDPNLGSGQNLYPQSVKPDELSRIFSPTNLNQIPRSNDNNTFRQSQQSDR